MGHYTRSEDVALEYLGISAKGVDAFLYTCASRVVEADDGSAHLHGHIHDFADFQSHCLRQRAAEYGEVLSEYVYESAVDSAVAGHYAVAEI